MVSSLAISMMLLALATLRPAVQAMVNLEPADAHLVLRRERMAERHKSPLLGPEPLSAPTLKLLAEPHANWLTLLRVFVTTYGVAQCRADCGTTKTH